MAAYHMACSSMWPPSSVRLSSITTRLASRSSPNRSIRLLLSPHSLNSSAMISVSVAMTSMCLLQKPLEISRSVIA
jgi:hypothetical protein